jgi:two-component system, cell cycle sensor histidine kinase and response regulator CckA
MIKRLTTSFYHSWQNSTLSIRLMFPIAVLMTASLLVSIFVFVTTTARTQNKIFEHETEVDMMRVTETLRERAIAVSTASSLLENDALVRQALHTNESDAWQVLNARAVVVHDRMDLDLVQIYDGAGVARANLLVSSLYRQSSLLEDVPANQLTLRAAEGRLLLLYHSELPGSEGAVIAGLDLETELRRIAHSNNMVSDLGLTSQGIQVATWENAPTLALPESSDDQYVTRTTITLADTPVSLTVTRQVSDIRRVISAGLQVMILGNVLTTFLLLAVGIAITRRTIHPVHQLAETARQITGANLSQNIAVLPQVLTQKRDTRNEISLLGQAFSLMMTELRGFYQELEDKVESRTRELLAAEDRYRRFFEEDLAGAFVCDPDGTLLACNRVFAQIFGFESVECALGTNITTLFPQPESLDEPLKWLRQQQRLDQYEMELRRRDGQLIQVTASLLATIDEASSISEIHGYILDNSKQKSLEEQLRQSQKMEAVGRLAGGVAHDFNNLLTVIIGHCQLLKLEGEGVYDEKGESTLVQIENIHRAAQRAAKLTRQLLAFSRRQLLQPETLSLNDIVNDMSNMLIRLIGEDVELVTHLPDDVGMVYADPSQMEQVIMNLVVNSRDAMPDGGQLTIETRNEFLDVQRAQRYLDIPPGRYVVLSISDTGCGMDRNTRERIFEPFFTTKEQGTGLGLSTVYGIVKQSNGQINVYSEPGHGTTFKIYLPCSQAVSEHRFEPAKAISSPFAGTETVLLVEDEDMVRDMAGAFLRRSGYTVLEAVDGENALDIISKTTSPIDLIVTDIVMPRMGGHELIARVRETIDHPKVLFMSGYTETAIIRESVLLPGTGFIQKPFTLESFLQKVCDILSRNADDSEPRATGISTPKLVDSSAVCIEE